MDAPPALASGVAVATMAWGLAAALVYAGRGLTLSHYDAKAHLVVARRVFDSLTPGWEQIGAVWLPLPHLLNLVPVQIDAFYRTGASGVLISIASFGLMAGGLAHLVLRVTRSPLAAGVTALLAATNPNLLYLQATPMTEPLLLGLLALGLALLYEGVDRDLPGRRRAGAVALTFACMTRYEAWPVTAAAFGLIVVAAWRDGVPVAAGLRRAAPLAVYPAAAIAWFFVHSRLSTGAWFVTGGFYVPDPEYRHRPIVVTTAVWHGVQTLGSPVLAWCAVAALVACLVLWWRRRVSHAVVVPLALGAAGALPWYAFFQGHPFRVRYMVTLVAAAVLVSGMGLGWLRRGRLAAAILLVAGTWIGARPFDPRAAMVLEAQWDVGRATARRAVTACLPPPDPDTVILMSMGALAHYMQELSRNGYAIHHFLHEGNGKLWRAAVERPSRYVRWVVVDEFGEGGDLFARRAREDARYLTDFERLCEGGGAVLYRVRERGAGN